MTSKKRLAPFVLLFVFASVLGACGDDDGDDAASGSASGSASGTGSEAETADSVTISMADYSYSVSGALAQGGELVVKNVGDEIHMMGIAKLKAGVTLDDLKEAMESADPESEEDPTAALIQEEVGWPGGFLTPGNEVTLSAGNLEPGTYGLICFLPTEGGGPPHFAQGMIGQLDVDEGDAGEPAEADASYRVTTGKPLEGPATLTAGTHTIEITGSADLSAHEPLLIKAQSADQTPDQINAVINEKFAAFESESGPPKGAGKALSDLVLLAGFDLGKGVSSVTFTFDFEPGTYFLAAPDTDGEDQEGKTPVELIKITVT